MDILISDAYIPVSNKFVKGYVYITDDVIAEIGEGEPPTDLQVSQLTYPIQNGVVLRGLSSPFLDLSIYWARGLIGRNISYYEATHISSNLDWKKTLSMIIVALRDLLCRGFTLFGLRLNDLKIAKYLEQEIGIDVAWITFEEINDSLDSPVIIGSLKEDFYPSLKITEKGVEKIVWRDNSRSLCTEIEEEELGDLDSLCLHPSLIYSFPGLKKNIQNIDSLYKVTSGNAYRQIFNKYYDFALNKNEKANIVIISAEQLDVSGLEPIEIAFLYYQGKLSIPSIEVVISNGNIFVDRGEIVGLDEHLLRVGIKEINTLRRTVLSRTN